MFPLLKFSRTSIYKEETFEIVFSFSEYNKIKKYFIYSRGVANAMQAKIYILNPN